MISIGLGKVVAYLQENLITKNIQRLLIDYIKRLHPTDHIEGDENIAGERKDCIHRNYALCSIGVDCNDTRRCISHKELE